jgi:hypothetical protein
MKRFFNIRIAIVTIIILAAAFSRLIHHIPNFSPIMAIALFGAAYFENKFEAIIIPLIAMFLSDIFLGFHSTMPAVYLSFVLGSVIGFLLLKKVSVGRIVITSLLSSALFFIITNFAVWFLTDYYVSNFAGLTKCYTMAIPFFRNAILGDMLYCGIIFGSFALIERYVPSLSYSEQ